MSRTQLQARILKGLIGRRVIATMDGSDIVAVVESWNTAAANTPFCAWPRGSELPNPLDRRVYMHRLEAEKLGLMPRTN